MDIRALFGAPFLLMSFYASPVTAWEFSDDSGQQLICADEPTFLANAISNFGWAHLPATLSLRDEGYFQIRWFNRQQRATTRIVFDLPENCYFLDDELR
jgi:hypothetical protein